MTTEMTEKKDMNQFITISKTVIGNKWIRLVIKILLALELLTIGLWIMNSIFYETLQLTYFHREVWRELLSEFTLTDAVVASMPIMVTAMGASFNERVGVINIGLEGIMLFSSWIGVYIALETGNIWLAGLVAVLSGGFMGFLHALFTVSFKAEQIVTGVAINTLALGLVRVLSIMIWGQSFSPIVQTEVPIFRYYNIPVLGAILKFISISEYDIWLFQFVPDVVKIFSKLNAFIWIAIILIPLLHILLFKTSFGLRIRVIGEHPQAAATAGIPVKKYQYLAVIISGLLSGFGGAILTLANNSVFRDTTVGGRGFIALAAMIYGKWTIIGSAMASLLFGYFFSLSVGLPIGVWGFNVPAPLFNTIPYLISIFALAGFIGKARPPKAIGKPYDPTEE